MGWQDRDYSRSRSEGSGDFWRRLFMGDFTLGHIFGIRVRIHAALIWLLAFRILFSGGLGIQTALISSAILFGIILLHEFGHCFAARSVGGRGDDVLMWPLGGLAFCGAPRRPWPSFVTTAGGPLTNLLICVVCGLLIRVLSGVWVVGNPLAIFSAMVAPNASVLASQTTYYLWWIYSTSLSLLLFNLLPIFPLDGGHLLQEILWARIGFYRSMNFAAITGMVGSVIMAILSFASIWMLFLWFWCFQTCYQTKMNLRALADEAWEEERNFSGNWSGNAGHEGFNLPRVSFGKKRPAKPRDDRFTLRDLNPLEWLAKRNRRKKFERLMKDD